MEIEDFRLAVFTALIITAITGICQAVYHTLTTKPTRELTSLRRKEGFESVKIGTRNVFLYWVGEPVPYLITVLRDLIYRHSKQGIAYQVHLINHDNLDQYVPASERPGCFMDLGPAHQADFVRIYCVCKYGGIWLDSDTLVMSDLSELFRYLETDGQDGFFVTEWGWICNGVFGSRSGTTFMKQWLDDARHLLEDKRCQNIEWIEIGGKYLTKARDEGKLSSYHIIQGDKSIYPVSPNDAVREYIEKPYDNYKTIERSEPQPLIVLVNSVYQKINSMVKSPDEITKLHIPLTYFINKSLANLT
jgi:hypothetical protein